MLDRYSLLCISVGLVVLTLVMFEPDDPDNDDIIGIAYDVNVTEKGYTFEFDDPNGVRMRCFFSDVPESNMLYRINGRSSDDGNMFFVSSMSLISSE